MGQLQFRVETGSVAIVDGDPGVVSSAWGPHLEHEGEVRVLDRGEMDPVFFLPVMVLAILGVEAFGKASSCVGNGDLAGTLFGGGESFITHRILPTDFVHEAGRRLRGWVVERTTDERPDVRPVVEYVAAFIASDREVVDWARRESRRHAVAAICAAWQRQRPTDLPPVVVRTGGRPWTESGVDVTGETFRCAGEGSPVERRVSVQVGKWRGAFVREEPELWWLERCDSGSRMHPGIVGVEPRPLVLRATRDAQVDWVWCETEEQAEALDRTAVAELPRILAKPTDASGDVQTIWPSREEYEEVARQHGFYARRGDDYFGGGRVAVWFSAAFVENHMLCSSPQ